MKATGRYPLLLEVCVDNVASAVSAENGGAGRIELCSSLLEGGLTPSVGFLKVVKLRVKIPVFVMIRPRGGNFVYSEDEILTMTEDIKALKANGADGFVFGILTDQCTVDSVICSRLLSLTLPLPVTFHRAFDLTKNPLEALDCIKDLGFQRVLTSGHQATAEKGLELIKSLVEKSEGKLSIMAGAGITPTNVTIILCDTGVTEVHASCRKKLSDGNPNNSNVHMGSATDEMNLYVADQSMVEEIVEQFKQF